MNQLHFERDVLVKEIRDGIEISERLGKTPLELGIDLAAVNPPSAPSGLGTRIERIAQPIARTIDKLTGTHIAGCGGCKKMRDRLNVGMPFTQALKLRLKGK